MDGIINFRNGKIYFSRINTIFCHIIKKMLSYPGTLFRKKYNTHNYEEKKKTKKKYEKTSTCENSSY